MPLESPNHHCLLDVIQPQFFEMFENQNISELEKMILIQQIFMKIEEENKDSIGLRYILHAFNLIK